MTATQILVIAFAAIGILALLAIGSVALRRGSSDAGAPKTGELDRRTKRKDRKAEAARRQAEEAATAEAAVAVAVDEDDPVDPRGDLPVVSEEDYDLTRRQFFNRSLGAVFGIFLAQFGIASLAFMWPKLRAGGFGGLIIAGNAEELARNVILPDGRVQPLFLSAAQSYVVPFQGNLANTSFDGLPVVAGGLMALWQRCVHLGCRVPTCESSQGFECPCHSSKYNYHGEYEDGPAPRNLDRFVVSVDEAGNLIIDTGQVIQTSRSRTKSAEFPQGPSCI